MLIQEYPEIIPPAPRSDIEAQVFNGALAFVENARCSCIDVVYHPALGRLDTELYDHNIRCKQYLTFHYQCVAVCGGVCFGTPLTPDDRMYTITLPIAEQHTQEQPSTQRTLECTCRSLLAGPDKDCPYHTGAPR